MQLYSINGLTKSRGYSFDHATSTKTCIVKLYDIMMKEKDIICFITRNSKVHKSLILNRDVGPIQLVDVGIDKIFVNTQLSDRMYQYRDNRSYTTNQYYTKLGLVFFYRGKWK